MFRRVPVDGSDDTSAGQTAVSRREEQEVVLAETLARLREEQATAAEESRTREKQLEETLENAQQVTREMLRLFCGIGLGRG